MSDRLRRFLHLERPRAPEPDGGAPEPGATSDRIAGVVRPSAGERPPPTRTGARLDRFAGAPAAPELELVDVAGDARPFTRCMRCGMDHSVFATECSGCSASLDTAAQRAFNEALWSRRQEEAAEEARAGEAHRAAQAQAEAEAAALRRELGETLAREVGRVERRRLDAEDRRLGVGGWASHGAWGGGGDPAPLGLKLLRLLPDPAARVAAGLAGLAIVGGIIAAGLRGRPATLVVGIAVAIALLSPPRWRRRW